MCIVYLITSKMFSKFTRKTRCLLWTAIVGGFLTVFSLVFALVILPVIIDAVLSDYLVLKEGTEAWDRFMELPFPMDFNIYFFEVTNPDEVKIGAKPSVKQVGPFIYKNYRKKRDVEILDDEHVSYYTVQTFEYDYERSELSDEDEVDVLNFLAIGLFQILENAIIDFEYKIEGLLPHVIGDSDLLFHKMKVKDFLFEGTAFCDPTETYLPAKLICLVVMLLNLKMVNYNDDLTMTYSLFGWKQNATDGKFVVNTGELDIMKLGQIQTWNDMKYTQTWKGEESDCNKVSGYDIAVFAPNMEEGQNFDIYSTDICRTMTMNYMEKSKFRDVNVYKYGFNKNTWRTTNCSPEESCFCSDYTRGLDGEKSCFMDGVQDVYPCLGIPGLASFPHFLHADEKYSSTVDHLHPNEDEHGSYLKMEPLTAAPLEGWISLQISLITRPIKLGGNMVEMTEHLNNTAMPLLWLQQGVTITDEYYDIIDSAMTLLLVADILKWVFVLISGLVFMFAASKLLLGTT